MLASETKFGILSAEEMPFDAMINNGKRYLGGFIEKSLRSTNQYAVCLANDDDVSKF